MLYNFVSTGPKAKTSDDLYQQLMRNNATWTIIDRGEEDTYLPIWELMSKLLSISLQGALIAFSFFTLTTLKTLLVRECITIKI